MTHTANYWIIKIIADVLLCHRDRFLWIENSNRIADATRQKLRGWASGNKKFNKMNNFPILK